MLSDLCTHKRLWNATKVFHTEAQFIYRDRQLCNSSLDQYHCKQYQEIAIYMVILEDACHKEIAPFNIPTHIA